MTIKIKRLDKDGYYLWDHFVLETEEATFFHQTRWLDLVLANYKHQPYYLYTMRDGAITAVLPLVQVRSTLLGTVLVSVPYAVYGGIVSRDAEDRERLMDASKDLAKRLGVRHVEYRNREPSGFELPSVDLYHTFIAPIPESEEECLTMIPRKSRASARQGRDKFGLEFRENNGAVDTFYELFVTNKRNLGSPVFSRSFFRSLMDIFDGKVFIHTVLYEGSIVSTVMSFVHRDMILPYYSGSHKAYDRYNTNNFQYWQLMVWAWRNGMSRYDFGRSRKETGAYKFKKNMGFTSQELNYQYFFPGQGEIPNLNPSNPKMDLPKKILRKMPVPLAKRVGPMLLKHLP